MAENEEAVPQRVLRQIIKLRTALENPEPLLKQLGALGARSAQRAFREQALGTIQWPARYPNQKAPKLNIAGALQDFKAGRSAPKPNRFRDRPALVDEGMRGGIQGSITFQVTGNNEVAWGTNKEYAAIQQSGGQSRQTVTKDAKRRIAFWLIKEQRQISRAVLKKLPKFKGGILAEEAKKKRSKAVQRAALVGKLEFLTKPDVTELVTNVHPRPFLGITDELERNLREATVRYFRRKAGGLGAAEGSEG